MALTSNTAKEPIVAVMLTGGRVTATFREALFDATACEGLSVNEFCLKATAEKLVASGRRISGLFYPGDLDTARGA
ncbi:hypothetical protein [Rhizobium leguminosarum]|uniref:hypothetical protein n=1 Tax=Rhizobium leguminosarum TaxID=384 RepID=UPI001C8FB3A1|nr:hypothetical protein [Rhizobium leguminosarum]MBY2932700.1 hypothetical protein [Rhizobium leguminosarum]